MPRFFVVAQLIVLSCLGASCAELVLIDVISAPSCCPYQFSVNDEGKVINELEWRYSDIPAEHGGSDAPKKFNYKPPPLVVAIYRSMLKHMEQDLYANPIFPKQAGHSYINIDSIDIDFGHQYVEILRQLEGPRTFGYGPSPVFERDDSSLDPRKIRLYDPSSPSVLGNVLGQYASTRMVMKFNVRPAGCDFFVPLKVDTGSQFHPENRIETFLDMEDLERYKLKFNQTLASSLAVLREKSERMLAHVMRYEACSG